MGATADKRALQISSEARPTRSPESINLFRVLNDTCCNVYSRAEGVDGLFGKGGGAKMQWITKVYTLSQYVSTNYYRCFLM